MIKYAIIEDEQNARNALKKMVPLISDEFTLVGEAESVAQGISLIEKNSIDILFLDIQIKEGTGFDVLSALDNIPFKVIFTTAHDEFAIKAFKFNAIDYLLKPINPNELALSLKHVTQIIDTERDYKKLLDQINKKENAKTITLKTTEQIYFVAPHDIVRLEGSGSYTTFVTKNQKIMVSKNLRFYEEMLLDYRFYRVHQSHLVNLNYVKNLQNAQLYLTNGDFIPISTRKKRGLLEQLEY